jgi:ATP-binding cassette subfamily C (CFTR/MRP) protein 1
MVFCCHFDARFPPRPVVSQVVMRYGGRGEPVLKSVSFTVPGGTKLGVVGRTGAGKSSIAAALFRLVEIDEGAIRIDGIDVSTVGLHTLRRRMAIVPQVNIQK